MRDCSLIPQWIVVRNWQLRIARVMGDLEWRTIVAWGVVELRSDLRLVMKRNEEWWIMDPPVNEQRVHSFINSNSVTKCTLNSHEIPFETHQSVTKWSDSVRVRYWIQIWLVSLDCDSLHCLCVTVEPQNSNACSLSVFKLLVLGG